MEGKVVRLFQGEKDKKTVYSDNPLEFAKKWQAEGAEWLHVVDLDGAINGVYSNLYLLEEIIENLDINVEISGGIRTRDILDQTINMGAKRVVLGTKAVEDPEFVKQAVRDYKEKIAVAVDMRKDKISARGWTENSDIKSADLVKKMQDIGVRCLICTDITRDGTLEGPNLEMIKKISKIVSVDLIASGGVSSLDDIKALKDLKVERLKGIIIGKALYENKFSLKEAIKAAK
jgi:phosphoribosylformimino-5-aminoimidazole carboxamide ribotide isomerase